MVEEEGISAIGSENVTLLVIPSQPWEDIVAFAIAVGEDTMVVGLELSMILTVLLLAVS